MALNPRLVFPLVERRSAPAPNIAVGVARAAGGVEARLQGEAVQALERQVDENDDAVVERTVGIGEGAGDVDGAPVALIGMQQGAELDLFAFFVSRSFGLKHYGAILMAGALSTAAALVRFGEVHDATGSYDIALKLGVVLFCVGALAFAAMGRTGRPPSSGAPARATAGAAI